MEGQTRTTRNTILLAILLGCVLGIIGIIVGIAVDALSQHGVPRTLLKPIGDFLLMMGLFWGVLTFFSGQRRASHVRRLGAAVLGALIGTLIAWGINRWLFVP